MIAALWRNYGVTHLGYATLNFIVYGIDKSPPDSHLQRPSHVSVA